MSRDGLSAASFRPLGLDSLGENAISALTEHLRGAGKMPVQLWVCMAEIPVRVLRGGAEAIEAILRVSVIAAINEERARATFLMDLDSYLAALESQARAVGTGAPISPRLADSCVLEFGKPVNVNMTRIADELVVYAALKNGMSPPVSFYRERGGPDVPEPPSDGATINLAAPREL